MKKIKKEIKDAQIWGRFCAGMAIAFVFGFAVSLIQNDIIVMLACGFVSGVSFVVAAMLSIHEHLLQDKLDKKEQKAKALESEEFYNLMQNYRNTPFSNQDLVGSNYNEVKNWIRENL